MDDLSPAAQAVRDAIDGIWSTSPALPTIENVAAAALRAAADQADNMEVPCNYESDSYWVYQHGQNAAVELLRSIADELEGADG